MDILYDSLKFLIIIIGVIVITRIFMELANYIGQLFGIGNFVVNLLQKIRNKQDWRKPH